MVLSAGVLMVWSAGGHQQFVVVGVWQVDLLCSLLRGWSESWKDDMVVECGMIREVLAVITFQFISGVFGTHPVSYFGATNTRRVTRFIVRTVRLVVVISYAQPYLGMCIIDQLHNDLVLQFGHVQAVYRYQEVSGP